MGSDKTELPRSKSLKSIFNPDDLNFFNHFSQTGCTVGISEEATKAAISIYTQSGQSPAQRKNKEERKDVKKVNL